MFYTKGITEWWDYHGKQGSVKEQIFFDFTRKRKTNVTGKLTLRSLSDLTLGQIGDIGKFCFNKEDGNADLATTVMTNKIDTHEFTLNLNYPFPFPKEVTFS